MNITVKDLLDAGVHFGHQTRRWNPKSKPFVYDHRSGVSIIDLEKTYAQLEKAVAFVEEVVADNNVYRHKTPSAGNLARSGHNMRNALLRKPLARRNSHQL